MSLTALGARRRTLIRPYNSAGRLVTPTYDGSGDAIHPAVVDMKQTAGQEWNGYRYWMAMTPYPNANDALENPSILASHDGLEWEVPPGLTNPIDPWSGAGYNSDTDLEWDPENERMLCYWRDYNGASGDPGNMVIAYSESTDGVTWTPQQSTLVLTFPDTSNAQLSPAVVRVAPSDWRVWLVGRGSGFSQVRTATEGTGPWSSPTNCTFNGTRTGDVYGGLWHWDIIHHDGIFYGAVSTSISDRPASRIHAMTSSDGIAWSLNMDPVLSTRAGEWDAGLYRPTLIHAGDRMRVWYSANDGAGTWGTGYTEMPLTEWPAPPTP